MSQRFGRNKRRRMRDEIDAADHVATMYLRESVTESRKRQSMERELHDLKSSILDVSRNSALLEPETKRVNSHLCSERYHRMPSLSDMVRESSRIPEYVADDSAIDYVDVYPFVVWVEQNPHALERLIHVAHQDAGEWRYLLSREALLYAPLESVAANLARQVVAKIREADRE